MRSQESSTSPVRALEERSFQVTHPFHPLSGCEFPLVEYRYCWREPRVYFYDETGRLASLPAAWTNIGPVDPWVEAAAGRSAFRLHDLLDLCELIRECKR